MTSDDEDAQSVLRREREVAYLRIRDLVDQREREITDLRAADDYNARSRFLAMLVEHNVPMIGRLETGRRYARSGGLEYQPSWMEMTVYQDLSYTDDPSWHPSELGCWQITVRQEDGHLSVRSWHWDGQTTIRYEKDTIAGHINFDIANVYNGHAETSDAVAARQAALSTPSIVALADAIRAVIRDTPLPDRRS